MYQVVEMEDTVRVPPTELSGDQEEITRNLVQDGFEGRLNNEYGFILLTSNIEPMGEGRVVHGDGAVFQRVKFDALCFKPEVGELVEGEVCEIVEFGAFVRFGPLDGLLHMSQIMNDYLNVDLGGERLTGKESGRMLELGDKVRARLVTVSLDEHSPRESKIGLTMRQPGLGKIEWLAEEDDRDDGQKPIMPRQEEAEA